MYIYVDAPEALKRACEGLRKEKEIGVDLECENNLHHYGAYISLIQISGGGKNYVVDILKLKELGGLIKIFEDSGIQKIFHGSDFDLRILNHQLDCRPKKIFDTQIAAQLLGKKEIGLGDLTKEYFGVEKIKKFQKADWTKRPLSKEMLDYASGDTIYLIRLRDKLMKEIKLKGRESWVEEDFLELEKKEWKYEEGDFMGVKGYSHLEPKQRAIFKRLYRLRERLAKQVDRPIHFLINNKRLMEYAVDPPKDWHRIRGVHPIVKKKGFLFEKELKESRGERLELPRKEKKRLVIKQRKKLDALEELQRKRGEELGVMKHLVMNKEQMIEIVVANGVEGLKKWQRELVEKEVKEILRRE